MVSVSHPHARELFERDAAGVVRFFEGKLGIDAEGSGRTRPIADWARARARAVGGKEGNEGGDEADNPSTTDGPALDVALAASGFKRKHEAELEEAFAAARAEAEAEEGSGSGSEESASSDSAEEGGDAPAGLLEDLRDRLQLGEDGEEEEDGGAGSLDGCASSDGEEGAPVAATPPPIAPRPPATPALDRAAAVAARLKAEAARAAKAAAAGRAARGAKAASSRAKRRETAKDGK